jgi:hypothetical protein
MFIFDIKAHDVSGSFVTMATHSRVRHGNDTWRVSFDASFIRAGQPLQAPDCFFAHSSGVKHFGVQAWMAAISSLSVPLTSRCRANVVFFANCADTIIASNI